MYDMYPWDSASRGGRPPKTPPILGGPIPPDPPWGGPIPPDPPGPSPQTPLAPLVQAVQIALDRRDNGGDGVAAAGQPTASRTRQ